MKRIAKFLPFIALMALLLFGFPHVHAQNGTPHGILTYWSAPSPVGGTGTIQGYYEFRCPGTCTASSTGWVAVSAILPPTSSGCTVPSGSANCYLDPSSGLSNSTTYSYAVLTVDSSGSESAYGNTFSVSVTTFPTNPNPPTGCGGKVQ